MPAAAPDRAQPRPHGRRPGDRDTRGRPALSREAADARARPTTADDLYGAPAVRDADTWLNATLHIGHCLLGIAAAGPMSGFDAFGVDREFSPGGDRTSLVLVTIGRPAETAHRPRQPRLDASEAVSFL